MEQGCPHTSQEVQNWCPLELTGQLTLVLDNQQLSDGSWAGSVQCYRGLYVSLLPCFPQEIKVQRKRLCGFVMFSIHFSCMAK